MALFENLEKALVLSEVATSDLITNNFDTPPSISNNFGARSSVTVSRNLKASEATTLLVNRGNYQTALGVIANQNNLPTAGVPNKIDLGSVYSNGFTRSVAQFRSENSGSCNIVNRTRNQTTVYTGDKTLDDLVESIKRLSGTTGSINTLLLK
jgi:hypothetical protein